MKSRRISFTTRYVVVVGLLLFLANVILGMIVLRQSDTAMKSLINKNMLDIANSAAGSLDGDVLENLTEEDVGSEAFQEIMERLTVFQKNVDIHYIYAVKQSGKGVYTFTVDPDPEEPAEFGEEVVVTNALVQAGKGIATVDDEPMADKWGNFYSVYSPVFDSEGKVGGIVGIDFDAEWYDHQVWMHTVAITIVTVLSVLIGGIVVLLITNRVRAGFSELNQGISSLSANVSELMEEIGAFSEHSTTVETESDLDDIEILNSQIREMQKEMVVYLEHLHTQAYTDSLTGIGNSTAYHERIRELEEAIAQGTAKFSVAVFDVNSLKEINDRFGHESGDRIICGAARSIADAMGHAYTYRIGGDEFAVVKESIDDSEMENMDAGIRTFNREGQEPILAVSKGNASYEPQVDMAFKDVFARADEAMYDDKKAYYETTGNRRKRRT